MFDIKLREFVVAKMNNCRPVTVEAQFHLHGCPYGNCGEESGAGSGIFSEHFGFSCQL